MSSPPSDVEDSTLGHGSNHDSSDVHPIGSSPAKEVAVSPSSSTTGVAEEESSPSVVAEESSTNVEEEGETSPDSPSRKDQSPSSPTEIKDAEELYYREEWAKEDKHFFILSNAGKPIYSRHGDEQKLCSFMGVLQALISFVGDKDDELRTICAGDLKIAFLLKGPLYFVCISHTNEPFSELTVQLEYLHLQILSILTQGVHKIYQTKAHFDIRGLLSGTDKFIEHLIRFMDRDPSFTMQSSKCLPLDYEKRSLISTILQSVHTEDLVYAVLTVGNYLVSFVQHKKHPLAPEDVHLILNFVNASGSFKSSESWSPMCLPKFNALGYLHTYVCYLTDSICLLLISTNSESFYELAKAKAVVDRAFTAAGVLSDIEHAYREQPYGVAAAGVPNVLHFLYKNSTHRQFTCPAFQAPYHTAEERARLFHLYQRVNDIAKNESRPGKPHRVLHISGPKETVLAWIQDGFTLFVVFGPLEEKMYAVRAANMLMKWIHKREQHLLIGCPTHW